MKKDHQYSHLCRQPNRIFRGVISGEKSSNCGRHLLHECNDTAPFNAIMTSERAGIEDVRVRQLADDIIRAQRKEIKEMEWLLGDIKRNGTAESAAAAQQRPVPKFEGKVKGEAL